MLSTLETAQLCAEAADSKKGFEILILDLRKLTYITDYFVICSAHNTIQVTAIADSVGQTLAKTGKHPAHIEGQAEAQWILMDYGDVVVHVFDDQTRQYYSLEKLWADAPRVPFAAHPEALKSASS
jgi:ribosome-associated protein